jgi:hypothetical protein
VKLDQVLKHFKTNPAGLAKKLDVSPGAISQWKTSGIPDGRQWQIQAISNGKLKAKPVKQVA